MGKQAQEILTVNGLKKYFPIRKGVFSQVVGNVKAVDGVSLSLREGETLGMVGESGCGKTTTGRCILRLIEPTEGRITYKGEDFMAASAGRLRALRRHMQIIFQDPYASLNPRMTVGSIVGEPFAIHNLAKGQEREDKVRELLKKVGLNPDSTRRYPHEFSGGQRQRIGIARALAVSPDVIICDEPVSALDVSIQAQVINLLKDLQNELNLTYLFIAHDLSVVEYISDRVAVMYLGKIVELARSEDLYSSPRHPYTEALLSASPVADPRRKKNRIILKGDVPTPVNPPSGCAFHPRCARAKDICKQVTPPLGAFAPDHLAACHFPVSPPEHGFPGSSESRTD